MKGIVWKGAPSGGPFHLLGIPGSYAAGVAFPLAETGKSESEMKRIIAQHPGCDLEIVDMDAPAPKSKAAKAAKEG